MTVSKSSSKTSSLAKKKPRSPKIIYIATEQLERSGKMLPWIGYLILGLTFLDYVFLLVPPHFLNPTWELNIIGHVIENVWAPIFGFALVFIRKENGFKKLELKVLSWLSRLMLLMAIIYFLSAPLIISNTIKIQQKNFSGMKTQLETQRNQVSKFKKQLSQIPEQQLANYLRQSQKSSPQKKSSASALLQQAFNQVDRERVKSEEQIKAAYQKQKLSLFKRSLKWCIGTLFSGATFLVFWKHTEWTRKTSSKSI